MPVLVTCGLWRHGSYEKLPHVQTDKCVDPRSPAPEEESARPDLTEIEGLLGEYGAAQREDARLAAAALPTTGRIGVARAALLSAVRRLSTPAPARTEEALRERVEALANLAEQRREEINGLDSTLCSIAEALGVDVGAPGYEHYSLIGRVAAPAAPGEETPLRVGACHVPGCQATGPHTGHIVKLDPYAPRAAAPEERGEPTWADDDRCAKCGLGLIDHAPHGRVEVRGDGHAFVWAPASAAANGSNEEGRP